MPNSFKDLVETLSNHLESKSMTLVTAESCTGGMIASAMTDRAGSSSVFERGYITYSNEAKHECLDVPADTLKTYGAVSEQTATAMAQGALNNSKADIAVSVTGIAGPRGGSAEKPVGTVYIGIATENDAFAEKHNFTGSRENIRNQTVTTALKTLIEQVKNHE